MYATKFSVSSDNATAGLNGDGVLKNFLGFDNSIAGTYSHVPNALVDYRYNLCHSKGLR